MQVWLALCGHRGTVSPALIEWVTHHEADLLPFEQPPTSRHRWASPDRSIQVFSWDNGQDVVDATIAETSDGGAFTAAGYLRSGPTLLTHLAAGEALSAAQDADATIESWGGIFSFCRVDGDGRLRAASSRGRLHSVFHATGAELTVTVVSNRPALAHQAARRRLDLDIDQAYVGDFLASGLTAIDRLPYVGVAQLPDGAVLTCVGDSVEEHQADRRRPADRGDVDAITSALVESVAFLADLDVELEISLTGGKDSRLIAALLKEAGVPFTSATSGRPDHPDVVLAARVAAQLGVPHRVVLPGDQQRADGTIDLGRRLTQVARGSDGMLSAFDGPLGSVVVRPGLRLGGAGGEVLRGGLAKSADVDAESMRRALHFQIAGHAMRLVPDMADAARQRADAWIESVTDMSPGEALADFHRQIRLGRRNMCRTLQHLGALKVEPFLDSQVIRHGMELQLDLRSSERAFHSVLASVNPELASMPLATSHWRFDPEGSPLASPGKVFNWRSHLSGQLGTALFDDVSSSPACDRLFDVVDHDAFETFRGAAANGRFDGQEVPARFLWSTVAALRLWEGDAARASGPILPINPPPPGPEPDGAATALRPAATEADPAARTSPRRGRRRWSRIARRGR